MRTRLPIAGVLVLCCSCVPLNTDSLPGVLSRGNDEATVASGLREALRIGSGRAVERTARPGGYDSNPLIHIPLPEPVQPVAARLRSAGLGGTVDEFESTMNRAAERAAQEAVPVFADAVTRMTIADALGILRGGDTAATDFFREQTRSELAQRFRPIVTQKMNELDLARAWNNVTAAVRRLSPQQSTALDLEDYVTGKALDGLFTILAEEETRIRTDPAARTTALLRRVFGSPGTP